MVKVEGLTVRYKTERGYFTALSNINMEVKDGSIITVIGPSGCGKSTLLHVLSGIIEEFDGNITINGEKLNTRKQRIGLVLQDYGLLPWKNVYENAVLGLKVKGDYKKVNKEYIHFILNNLGLIDYLTTYPNRLSGGQKQRVAIARALILKPDILLMDEPFSALDEMTREEMQDLILNIWEEYRVTTIFVTHNLEEAVYIGQKIIVMSRAPGRIIKVIENPVFSVRDKRINSNFYKETIELRHIVKEVW